jgi:hypothetical protein
LFAGGLRDSTEAVLGTAFRGSPETVGEAARPLPRMMIGARRDDVFAAGALDAAGCWALLEADAVGDRLPVVSDACWPTTEVGLVVVVGRTTVGAGAGG